jgi:hypothetical protein
MRWFAFLDGPPHNAIFLCVALNATFSMPAAEMLEGILRNGLP